MAEQGLALPALEWSDETTARVSGPGLGEDAATLLLFEALRAFASRSAGGGPVSPVSITLDHTAPFRASGALDVITALDRRTRTLVFAHGSARSGDTVIMTATAVYRIDTP